MRITARVVETYGDHQRLSSHLRLPGTVVNQYATNDADVPPGPGYQQWGQDRVRAGAHRIGANTQEVIARIIAAVPIADQGLNPALAFLRLLRRYSHQRLGAACALALASRVPSRRYAHVRFILESGQDKTGAGSNTIWAGTRSYNIREHTANLNAECRCAQFHIS